MEITLIAGMVVLGIINMMLLFFVFTLFKDNSAIKLLLSQVHHGMSNIATRQLSHEAYLQKVGASFTEFTTIMEDMVERLDGPPNMPGGKFGMMYRTLDGKYAASSLEDLINKIKKDGTEDSYLSNDEINELRKMFEGSEPLDESNGFEDEGEDEDEGDFNPEQGKL